MIVFIIVLTTELFLQFVAGLPCVRLVTKSHYSEPYCGHYHCYERDLVEDEINLYCDETNLDEIYKVISNETRPYSLTIKNTVLSQMGVNPTTWNNILGLSMANTSTLKIVPGFFNKLIKLETLEITNNNLSGVVDGTFSPLSSLKNLNLSNNAITSFSEHSFSGLFELKSLDLSYNNLSFIDSKAVSLNSNLAYINLTHNYLANVEVTTFQSIPIIEIDLSCNRLTNFSFSDKTISYSNATFYNSVENVNLSGNVLESIEDYFVGPEVDTADLSNNIIKLLAKKAFFTASKLRYLYLNNNKLTSIHRATFSQQINLKYLDLSSNPIVTITFGLLNNLKSLEYLDLSSNNTLLDFHFLFSLKKLKTLKMSNTNIMNFDITLVVSYFSELEEISLSDNLWTCSELMQHIYIFEKNNIKVVPGNHTDSHSFFGISCLENENSKNETITINRNNIGNVDSSQDSLENFLNYDFKNTSFYKFFESFKNFSNSNIVPDKNHITLNMEKNFTSSNLVNLLQKIINDISVSQIDSNTSTNDKNKDILGTKLPKFYFPINFTSELNDHIKDNMLQYQNITLKVLSQYSKQNSFSYENLFTNIVMVLILICIVVYICYTLFRQKKAVESREAVQLI